VVDEQRHPVAHEHDAHGRRHRPQDRQDQVVAVARRTQQQGAQAHAAASFRLTYATNPPASTMPMTPALSGGNANSPAAQRITWRSVSTVTASPGWIASAAAGQAMASRPLLSALR